MPEGMPVYLRCTTAAGFTVCTQVALVGRDGFVEIDECLKLPLKYIKGRCVDVVVTLIFRVG